MKKKTLEEFIEDAKKVHGNKYDYSKVKYIDARTKVCIICPEHGEFWQTPRNHITCGDDCPECAKIKYSEKRFLGKEEFIQRAKEVHKNKYDYLKVEYKNSLTKVCIICPEHGEFWQTPATHLKGIGCPKCGKLTAATSHRLTTDEFIQRAKEIHGNKYDYSKTEYKSMKEPVCIICPEHGEFLQVAHTHLTNHGCPKCSSSRLEIIIKDTLEKSNIQYVHQCKFDWLKDINHLTVDFYLPEYNVVIECQGLQHFRPCDFGSKKRDKNKLYESILKHDKIKFEECKKHNIDVLYFSNLNINYPYSVFENENELIEEILNHNKNEI